jgi:hypothetical protein
VISYLADKYHGLTGSNNGLVEIWVNTEHIEAGMKKKMDVGRSIPIQNQIGSGLFFLF